MCCFRIGICEVEKCQIIAAKLCLGHSLGFVLEFPTSNPVLLIWDPPAGFVQIDYLNMDGKPFISAIALIDPLFKFFLLHLI